MAVPAAAGNLPSVLGEAAVGASAATTLTDEAVSVQMNPAHTGGQSGDSLAPPLIQKWALDFGSDNTVSYPLIAGGRIFITTMSTTGGGSTLRALNASDGRAVWGPIALRGWITAAYDVLNGQGLIFTRSNDNTVRAFSAATGAQLWTATTYDGTASPVAANGLVYISYSNQLEAFHQSDGSVAWTSPVLHGDDTTPAVTATDVYVNYACNQVYDLNASTGAIVWHADAPCEGGGWHQSPAVYGGRLYTREISFGNYTWNATTGAAVASFSANPPPAFDGGLGFFLTARTLQAEDVSTSRILWKFRGDGQLSGTSGPVTANGIVYIGSRSGALYAINALTGTVVWSGNAGAPIGWAADIPFSGLAIGEGLLAVPASNRLVIFAGTGTPGSLSYTAPAPASTSPYSGTDQAVAYQIDPAHSGGQPLDSLTPPLKQLWAIDFENPVSYPIIAGGKVFVTVRNDAPPDTNAAGTAMYALAESTGQTIWGPTDLGGGVWSGVTYEGGRVFVKNNDDLLRGFDGASGNQLWAAQLPWGTDQVAPPTASRGTVYSAGSWHIPGAGGYLAAVRESDGVQAWPPFVSVWGGRSSPAVSATGVYASTTGQAIDLNPATGEPIWQVAGTVGLTTVLHGGRLYERGPGIIHDASTGQNLGAFDAGPPPAFDGTRGFFLNDYILQAKDMATLPGSSLWSFTGDGGLDSAPLVVNGVVYVGSLSGMLYGLGEATGAVLWKTNVGAPINAPDDQNNWMTTGMAAGEGVLVVAAGNRLVAYTSGTSPPAGCVSPGSETPSLSNPYSAVSSAQYHLSSSDGQVWHFMDQTALSMTVRPPRDAMVLVTGNADLWTANAGYNQDLGIWVSGGDYGAGQVVAWKESGGFSGTFSPNAAFVQGVVTLKGPDLNTGLVTTYSLRLVWKTNRPAAGATIYAGAGPIDGRYSPTRMTAELLNFPGPNGNPWVGSTTAQPSLADSNGVTWEPIDSTNLSVAVTVGGPYRLLVRANADLWTERSGYNQDLGIFISINGGPDQLLAWKESGGGAGSFSPNAAAVQAAYSIGPGSYRLTLKWKTNRPATGVTIHAGAGPWSAQYSPTNLIAWLTSSPQGTFTAVSSKQYRLSTSDGAAWIPLDDATFSREVTTATTVAAILHTNADMWTASSGYNQDVGIFVSINGCPPQLVAWKESGGSAGTFSPNAAFVQSVMTLTPGNHYVFSLRWKASRAAAGKTIAIGAGPIDGQYSPTSLTIEEAAPVF